MFAYPWVLLLLTIPIWQVYWVWTRKSGRVALPHDFTNPVPARGWTRAIHLAESLPALLLAVAIILVADPLKFGQPVEKRQLTNIEIVIDVSRSMTLPLGQQRRYDAAMQALNTFLDARQGDAFGLTFFGNESLHWAPITTDVSAIRLAAPFMDPQKLPGRFGGTAIGKALLGCRSQFAACPPGDKLIVLISDGESGDFMQEGNDELVGQQMKDAGIQVHTIHIGQGSIPVGVKTVARISGGTAFSANDSESLKGVFARIDSMQRMELQRQTPEKQDDYVIAAATGLGTLLLSLIASFGLRYTPW